MRIDSPSPIELARRARGWSQTDLARAAGLGRHTIALSERGYRPSDEARRKIADVLGSTVAELWLESHNDHEPRVGLVEENGGDRGANRLQV